MSKKKYILTGFFNRPCTQGGVKRHPAVGNVPFRTEVVQVKFTPGVIVETELDMSSAERAGFIRCVGEETDAPPVHTTAEKPIKTDAALTLNEQRAKDEKEAAKKEAAEKVVLEEDAATEEAQGVAEEAEEKEAEEKAALEEAEKEAAKKEVEDAERAAEAEREADKKADDAKKKAQKLLKNQGKKPAKKPAKKNVDNKKKKKK